jgi:4-hydroxybenzoyl-CoA reductase subunit beta
VRRVALEQLYQDDGIEFLAKRRDELLRKILIPRGALGSRNVYVKLRRRGSFDFPVLGVAAAMTFGKQGICRSVRVVLTAVSSAPKEVEEATHLLVGKKVTRDIVEAVGDAAAKESHPLDNADMDYWYRKRMTKVYVKKALAQLAGVELKEPMGSDSAV